MKQSLRDKLVYRIIHGITEIKIGVKLYYVVPADSKIRYRAQCIYDEAIQENRFCDWLTDARCKAILVHNELCHPAIDDNIKTIDSAIEDLKLELFESFMNPDEYDKVKKRLAAVRVKQEQMHMIRHSMKHLTLSGYAESVKQSFIFSKTIRGEDMTPLWPATEFCDAKLMERIMSTYYEHRLDVTELRELARTDPWRSYWNVTKSNPMGCSSVEMSNDQRTLVLFSKMYDSVYEHPECPIDKVINNDDLFDGWMIMNRRKQEKEKMSSQLENQFDRHGKADEIFLPGKDKAARKKINDLNDTHGKVVKAQRNQVVQQRGTATDANFPDRKLQVQQQSNEKFVQTVKGK